jgi:D-alanyl-D-alanine carboxypeptidase
MFRPALLAAFIIASLLTACGNRFRPPVAPPVEDARMPVLRAAAARLPLAAASGLESAVRGNESRFFALVEAAEAESSTAGGFMMLVDKKNPLPEAYEPPDLVPLDDYPLSVSRNDLRLRKAVIEAVLELDAAAKADGVSLLFSSAFRSYAYQAALFARYSAEMGKAEASRVSARAGTSQHQLGTVVDLGSIDDSFASTKAGVWMAANAGRFGFSLSFPQGMEEVTGYVWESWHYRYITKPGTTLEREFFGGVQQYLIEFLAAYRSVL